MTPKRTTKRPDPADIPELRDPGEREPLPCSPGSIEQQLDMCEWGELKGDDILFSHGDSYEVGEHTSEIPVDELMARYEMDLAETDREGDEMSGDEHSSGLQGGEQELEGQPHIHTGMPGDRTRRTELVEKSQRSPELSELGGELEEFER